MKSRRVIQDERQSTGKDGIAADGLLHGSQGSGESAAGLQFPGHAFVEGIV